MHDIGRCHRSFRQRRRPRPALPWRPPPSASLPPSCAWASGRGSACSRRAPDLFLPSCRPRGTPPHWASVRGRSTPCFAPRSSLLLPSPLRSIPSPPRSSSWSRTPSPWAAGSGWCRRWQIAAVPATISKVAAAPRAASIFLKGRVVHRRPVPPTPFRVRARTAWTLFLLNTTISITPTTMTPTMSTTVLNMMKVALSGKCLVLAVNGNRHL